jgi:large subunit ribosomal protein L3
MTRLYDEKGCLTTATVIEAGGNRILQVKNADKDGYGAVQVGFGDQKPQRVGKAQTGHFAKTSSTPKKFIREFRLAEGEAAPENADIAVTVFEVGQFVDVIGQSKGPGIQGVVKKHNFDGQPASHGSMMHRRSSATNCYTTRRYLNIIGIPVHMGDELVPVQYLRVIQIREDDGVILVSGAVPGANGSNVIVRPAKKKPAKAEKNRP